MILNSIFAFLVVSICVVFKRNFWLHSTISNQISLSNSYLCWFTLKDLSSKEYKPYKWLLLFNNITNIIVAVAIIILLVKLAVVCIGFLI